MTPAYLSPPTIGRQLGVKPDKILRFIASGELLAVNVAERPGGRPRWRISREALDAFLAARGNRPAVKAVRRRKSPLAVTEFFA